jgi:hypothetical protein
VEGGVLGCNAYLGKKIIVIAKFEGHHWSFLTKKTSMVTRLYITFHYQMLFLLTIKNLHVSTLSGYLQA